MSKGTFLRFLWAADAIQAHLVCGPLIVLLSIRLWTGDAQPDYIYGLVFAHVVPILLAPVWWSQRLGGRVNWPC